MYKTKISDFGVKSHSHRGIDYAITRSYLISKEQIYKSIRLIEKKLQKPDIKEYDKHFNTLKVCQGILQAIDCLDMMLAVTFKYGQQKELVKDKNDLLTQPNFVKTKDGEKFYEDFSANSRAWKRRHAVIEKYKELSAEIIQDEHEEVIHQDISEQDSYEELQQGIYDQLALEV